MEPDALEAELADKVRTLLGKPELAPTPDILLHRLPGWDSLRLMNLLMQLERQKKLRFQASEVAKLKTWGDLLAMVRKAASNGR
jgi:acyl carrier protein